MSGFILGVAISSKTWVDGHTENFNDSASKWMCPSACTDSRKIIKLKA